MDEPAGRLGAILEMCESVEDWQERLMAWVVRLQKNFIGTKEAPGPGRCVPVVFGIDSLMGKLSEESQAKIVSDGSGSRMHPVEAMIITQYLKTIPNMLIDWPFSLVLVNHLKMGKDKHGYDERNRTGGKGVSFQQSWEIETGIRKGKIHSASWEGTVIKLRCYKNSFGSSDRTIDTRMLYWKEDDPETGKRVQRTYWDWDWALIDLLGKLPSKPAAMMKKLDLHVATPKTSVVENTAWSRTLGMKASDAVPWAELGRMLREDVEVANRLRKALDITSIPVLSGDYAMQREELVGELP